MGITRGEKRFYRKWHSNSSGIAYEVQFRQTDLWIRTKKNYERQVLNIVAGIHRILHQYASRNPAFFSSLTPLPLDPLSHPFIKRMLIASQEAQVGPMASVAGLIAETVGKKLVALEPEGETIVENGGDCFIYSTKPVIVEIFPGKINKTLPLKLQIEPPEMPLCVCTSSSQIGHSLSFGNAEAVTVISKDGALADAVATSLCNQIKSKKQLKQVLESWGSKEKIHGIVAIINGHIAMKGNLRLV